MKMWLPTIAPALYLDPIFCILIPYGMHHKEIGMVIAGFPGQGSQAIGMGKELYQNFASARLLFQEAEDTLSEHLTRYLFEGPEEALRETRYAQPAIFLVSMVVLKILEEEFGITLDTFQGAAGHSLGEYSALCGTGVLSFGDALRLIKIRCQEMSKVSDGGMLAILGLNLKTIEDVVQAMPSQYGLCEIANDNTPQQIVLSGQSSALEEVSKRAIACGAKRCVFLQVSGPFHSSLMQSAQRVFAERAQEITFSSPSIPIYTNVSAMPQRDPDILRENLIRQITHRVQWRQTQLNWQQEGCTHLMELGGNGVLCGLARKTVPLMQTSWMYTLDSLQSFATQHLAVSKIAMAQ